MKNIIETKNATLIFNGGDPLDGCPKSYNEANNWADRCNQDKDKNDEPVWSFDCGFKLDFDGPILSVSSRFYPPKTHYGPKWDGTVSIYLLGKKVNEEKFEEDTLDTLRIKVESYVKKTADQIR